MRQLLFICLVSSLFYLQEELPKCILGTLPVSWESTLGIRLRVVVLVEMILYYCNIIALYVLNQIVLYAVLSVLCKC